MYIYLCSLDSQFGHLIGHWGFEEGNGTVALDSSENALNGVITNAVYTTGKIGDYALDFNGSNAFVEIAHQYNFHLQQYQFLYGSKHVPVNNTC